jgi:hypothetical protein
MTDYVWTYCATIDSLLGLSRQSKNRELRHAVLREWIRIARRQGKRG